VRRLAVLAGSLLGVELGSQEMRATRVVVNHAESLYVSVWGRGNDRDAEGAFGARERLPVVMVPGIWSSAYGFRKVLPGLLGQGVSVIIIEPLGVAASSRRHGADYSMTAQARRIAAALDSLRVREAVFVGQALST
jgi:pimeloyl-ACP methyl ester carboxylesterase